MAQVPSDPVDVCDDPGVPGSRSFPAWLISLSVKDISSK